jgi:hypothetical protein
MSDWWRSQLRVSRRTVTDLAGATVIALAAFGLGYQLAWQEAEEE